MSKKIRVLQLGSPSGLYGAERWILALVKHLDKDCIESWVGAIQDTPNTRSPLCEEAAKLGFATLEIEAYGRYSFSSIVALRAAIKKHAIDIIHTHGYKTDIVGFFSTLGSDCKVVSTPHGWTEKPDPKLWCYEVIDRLFFPFLDAVVPLSMGLYQPLSHWPFLRHKLFLVQNGVDMSEVQQTNVVAEEILALKAKGQLVIGYIGRLTPGKGLDVLFNAIAQYGDQHWHVALVGEGEQEQELRAMVAALGIERQVSFFGFRPDRLAFLKGFDLFALPSRSEGIPRCLMESMTAEVPVVASDIPGCRNLIEHEKTGLLFELDNVEALASAIKQLESDESEKAQLIDEAKQLINNKYSASRMAEEYQGLFLDLLDSP